MNAKVGRLHAIVHGKVQGVSFRYYTQQRAQALGLRGWVRNLDDGTVETEAEGSRAQLDEFQLFLHEGPLGARVRSVDLMWIAVREDETTFEIRY